MNNENNNNSQKILKISYEEKIPQNYSGIVEMPNGSKFWHLNGKLHRTDGPAFEHPSGYKSWYLNGKLHRTDGPAKEWTNGDKEWFLNGIRANQLFFKIPDCEKYIDYYMAILQTELVEHEEFLLEELKKHVNPK